MISRNWPGKGNRGRREGPSKQGLARAGKQTGEGTRESQVVRYAEI